ncbi:MAG: glutamate-cysteine ligase family protein [Planctomycetaceae bacterium]
MPDSHGLFSVYGVELEYMVVDAESLDVCPVADRLLCDPQGQPTGEVCRDGIDWLNELVAHVVELKTAQPAPSLTRLADRFQAEVVEINHRLAPLNARLMPGGMHPWMDPAEETVLWPHAYGAVYSAFDQVFGCQGHGWSNLQSVHLNLPFHGPEEFGRLHAAIRLVLPLLPALTASSPVVEDEVTGLMDNRLEYYRLNSRKIPEVAGRVIPEAVFTPDDYAREILQPLYAAIAPHDPAGVLQHEWLNARGAIARFERGAIEIRVMDVQECPLADLSICAAVVAVLRELVAETHAPLSAQMALPGDPLQSVFLESVRNAERTVVWDEDYLKLLGISEQSCTLQKVWDTLIGRAVARGELDRAQQQTLEVLLSEGPLARRICRGLRDRRDPSPEALAELYEFLCDCLAQGTLFQIEG